jgi:hypothetical protein
VSQVQHLVSEPLWPKAMEHGHAVRAWSAAAAADLRGGAAWLGGVEEKPFVQRVRQLERPRCLRQGATCACAEGVRITGGERVQRSAGRPCRSRQCAIVCASRGMQGVASSRSSACVVEELDLCRR